MSRTLFLSFLLILGAPHVLFGYGLGVENDEGATETDLQMTSDAQHIRRIRVNCDRGHTIARALRSTAEKLRIHFRGTCEEDVLIERDDVTLSGFRDAPTIIGTVTVRSSSRIVLEDFLVRDAPNSGIEIFNGSAATLRRLDVSRTGARGINIRNSSADLSDIRSDSAGNVALVFRGSQVLLTGSILATNSLFGVSVTEGSSAFLRGGSIDANNNTVGLTVQIASELAVVEGSALSTNDNLSTGIFIGASGNLSFEESTLESLNNGFLGLWMNQFASFAGFSGTSSPVLFAGNGLAGALVEKTSSAEFGPDSVFTDNGFGGVLVSESSVELTDVTIRDNAVLDLSMRFGSTATFDGEAIDIGLPIDCDDTVLTRGPLACAEGAAAVSVDLAPLKNLPRLPTMP